MKKFDVVVQSGELRRNEYGLMAENLQALQQILSQCDEKVVDVIREYEDGDCKDYGKFDAKKILDDMNNAGPMSGGQLGVGVGMMRLDDEQKKAIETSLQNSKTTSQDSESAITAVTEGKEETARKEALAAVTHAKTVVESEPPKYFKVGDTECMMKDGKVYERKWIDMSQSKARNYRLVSDKTNRIVPMTGKHLQEYIFVISQNNEDDTQGDNQ